MLITPEIKQWLIDEDLAVDGYDDAFYQRTVDRLVSEGTTALQKYQDIIMKTSSPSPDKIFRSGGNDNIRVRDASEQYDDTRYAAKHVKTGLPVIDPVFQRECCTMSEGSKARAGVLLKHLANKSGIVSNPLSEHEQSLLDEVCEKHHWAGKVGGEFYDSVSGHRNVKALIDGSTSGGLEIVPIEFDSDVVTFPLLHGELFPQVDLKPVPRGRRIEGASIGTPTMAWGGADDSAIDLFSTTDLVAAIDTTIFAVDGAIEVGRDFLSDSPVAVGETLTALIGERLMSQLDYVIGSGNGTTQPEGIFVASGVGTVTPDNTTTGPPTLDDYLDLMFAVGKQYRKPAFRPMYISNDTTYQRSRAIKVDPASPSTDQRPVLAPLSDVSSYRTLGWDHKIQNDLANGRAAFVCMAKYRMYRRLGLEIRWVDGGTTLARRNMMLLTYRARFGGRLMDSSAAAKWTNGQS